MKNNLFIIVGLGVFVASPSGWAIDRPFPSSESQQQEPLMPGTIPSKGGAPIDKASPSRQQVVIPLSACNSQRGRAVLGIQPGVVGPELKAQLGLSGFSGVLVEDVVAGSPAAKAGMHKFDIILKVSGKPINEFANIREALADAGPGDQVAVEVLRSNKLEQLELVLDQAMMVREDQLKQQEAPVAPLSPDHIRRAIGAGRISMPENMCETESMIAMINMMSELLDKNKAWNNQAMALERVDRMRRLTDQMHRQLSHRQNIVVDPSGVLSADSSYTSNFLLRDAKGVIELKTDSKNGTRLVVKDTNGQVIFDGPYATEADRSKVPDAIKQRMDGVCIHLQTS